MTGRGLAVVAGLGACGRDAAPPPPAPSPPADARLVAPAADASPSGPELLHDSNAHALAYGLAAAGLGGNLDVALSSTPSHCADDRTREPTSGYALRFELPGGPGGAHYAGHPTGVLATVEGFGQTAALPGPEGFRVPLVDIVPALVTLDPVPSHAHARLTGAIDLDAVTLFATWGFHGRFDVELCDELPRDPHPLRATAPTTPLAGAHGRTPLVPRTVHALVGHRWTSRRELLAHRDDATPGPIAELDRLVFYADANVPCPATGELVAGRHLLGAVRSIGGTNGAHPALGAPQPTQLAFAAPGGGGELDSMGDLWPAWVQIDAPLAYTTGSPVHGALWAEAPAYLGVTGTFGGQLDAVVCEP